MISSHVEGLLGKHSIAFPFRSFQPVDANRRSETGNIVSKYFIADAIVEYIDGAKKKKKKKEIFVNTRRDIYISHESREMIKIFSYLLSITFALRDEKQEGNFLLNTKNSTYEKKCSA